MPGNVEALKRKFEADPSEENARIQNMEVRCRKDWWGAWIEVPEVHERYASRWEEQAAEMHATSESLKDLCEFKIGKNVLANWRL